MYNRRRIRTRNQNKVDEGLLDVADDIIVGGDVEDGSGKSCLQCKFCLGCPSSSSHQCSPQSEENITGLA